MFSSCGLPWLGQFWRRFLCSVSGKHGCPLVVLWSGLRLVSVSRVCEWRGCVCGMCGVCMPVCAGVHVMHVCVRVWVGYTLNMVELVLNMV